MHERTLPTQEKDIDNAKAQVQGQLAAQYIQDVMQVRHLPMPGTLRLPACDALHPCMECALWWRAQKITDKCYTRCVIKPGPKLDDSEKLCTAKCMDRYLDAMALVSQAWAARAKQQAAMGGGMPDGGFQ